MRKEDLEKRYFDWMVHLVCNDKYSKNLSYHKLLAHLHKIEFTYIINLDENRAGDGINLRYRFGYERGYEDSMIASYLDTQPCSVLEMMIALAYRCENSLMEDDAYGDRTGQWFWNMIVSLRLGSMTDSRFDVEYVDEAIAKFLNRDYEPDGKGGLFTVSNPQKDMRDVEIWYQMCWYITEFLDLG